MTLNELIDQLRELRDQRGGECPVLVVNPKKANPDKIDRCKVDTTAGQTIIEIITQ